MSLTVSLSARVVNNNGNSNWNNVNKRNNGVRPDSLLKESLIDSENKSE